MQLDHHRHDALAAPGGEASAQAHANDNQFKLHFPVPKDRTMRRIALTQLALLIISPAACVGTAVVSKIGNLDSDASPNSLSIDTVGYYNILAMILATVGIASLIGIFAMSFIHSTVMTRRYGWRAMSDPIEAQRVAIREGFTDAIAGSSPNQRDQVHHTGQFQSRRMRPITARFH